MTVLNVESREGVEGLFFLAINSCVDRAESAGALSW